jgi:hypothetical protein
MISLLANQQMALISPHVKIYTQLTEKNKCLQQIFCAFSAVSHGNV